MLELRTPKLGFEGRRYAVVKPTDSGLAQHLNPVQLLNADSGPGRVAGLAVKVRLRGGRTQPEGIYLNDTAGAAGYVAGEKLGQLKLGAVFNTVQSPESSWTVAMIWQPVVSATRSPWMVSMKSQLPFESQ